jgi:hypothetical protein
MKQFLIILASILFLVSCTKSNDIVKAPDTKSKPKAVIAEVSYSSFSPSNGQPIKVLGLSAQGSTDSGSILKTFTWTLINTGSIIYAGTDMNVSLQGQNPAPWAIPGNTYTFGLTVTDTKGNSDYTTLKKTL